MAAVEAGASPMVGPDVVDAAKMSRGRGTDGQRVLGSIAA